MNIHIQNRITRFRIDNINKRIKTLLIKNLTIFINNKIEEIYNNKKDNGKRIKRLMKTFLHAYNRTLLTTTLLEIFSESNNRYNININLVRTINKKVIEELLNEKDDDKRYYFQNLFNLHFLDCLDHFSNKRVIEELQGLKTFNEIKNDENELKKLRLDDKEYLDEFEYYLNYYEEILNKTRRRERNHA